MVYHCQCLILVYLEELLIVVMDDRSLRAGRPYNELVRPLVVVLLLLI